MWNEVVFLFQAPEQQWTPRACSFSRPHARHSRSRGSRQVLHLRQGFRGWINSGNGIVVFQHFGVNWCVVKPCLIMLNVDHNLQVTSHNEDSLFFSPMSTRALFLLWCIKSSRATTALSSPTGRLEQERLTPWKDRPMMHSPTEKFR